MRATPESDPSLCQERPQNGRCEPVPSRVFRGDGILDIAIIESVRAAVSMTFPTQGVETLVEPGPALSNGGGGNSTVVSVLQQSRILFAGNPRESLRESQKGMSEARACSFSRDLTQSKANGDSVYSDWVGVHNLPKLLFANALECLDLVFSGRDEDCTYMIKSGYPGRAYRAARSEDEVEDLRVFDEWDYEDSIAIYIASGGIRWMCGWLRQAEHVFEEWGCDREDGFEGMKVDAIARAKYDVCAGIVEGKRCIANRGHR